MGSGFFCNFYRCYGSASKQVVLVPLVRIVNFMGIHDTLAAVILLLLAGALGVFLS